MVIHLLVCDCAVFEAYQSLLECAICCLVLHHPCLFRCAVISIYIYVLIKILYKIRTAAYGGIYYIASDGFDNRFSGILYRRYHFLRNKAIGCLSDVIEYIIYAIEIEFKCGVCIKPIIKSLEWRIFEFRRHIEEVEDRDVPCPLCYLLYLAFDSLLSNQSYSSFHDAEYLSDELRHLEDAVDFRQYLSDFRCWRQDRQIHLDAWDE